MPSYHLTHFQLGLRDFQSLTTSLLLLLLNFLQPHNNHILAIIHYSKIHLLVFLISPDFTFYTVLLIKKTQNNGHCQNTQDWQ